jgi:hypothetical protein
MAFTHMRLFFTIPATPQMDERFEDLERRLKKSFPMNTKTKGSFCFYELEYDDEDCIFVVETEKLPDEHQVAVLQAIINNIVGEINV